MKPSKRVLPKTGDSYVDVNNGRIIRVEDDVLDIKKRVEERWDELEVLVDGETLEYLIVENCRDQTQRLVFATEELDERVIMRIERAMDCDIEAAVDAANAARERDQDSAFSDKIGDASEHLLHALKKDGLGGIPSISTFLPKDSSGRSRTEDGVSAIRGS